MKGRIPRLLVSFENCILLRASLLPVFLFFIFLSTVCPDSSWSAFRLVGRSVYANHTNSRLHADVSQEYIRWSEWHHKQLKQVLNRKLSTTVNPNTTIALTTPTTSVVPTMTTSVLPQVATTALTVTSSNWSMLSTNLHNNSDLPLTNVTESGFTYTTGVTALLATLTAITSVITVSGNLLVLLSFFVERALRTATNYFLASLAVTDLLIGVFSMNFYTLYLILGHWPLGRLSCDLWLSLDYTACLTSQYTVLIITIDRFCSVRLPAKYRNWRTDRKVFIMVAATWIIPSSVFFPTIMGWPYFKAEVITRQEDECYAEFANDPVFNTVFTLCYFWVTLFVMSGLYVGIYKVAVNLQKRSDEKRNRVSGLIPNSAHGSNKLAKNALNAQNQKKQQKRQQKLLKKNNQTNVPSSSLPGESSGFDSDEEQQQQQQQNAKKKVPQATNNNTVKGTTNFQSMLPSNMAMGLNDSDKSTPTVSSTLTTKITVQPALLEEGGKFELPVFERKPKKPEVIIAKPPPKMQCPVHGRPSIVSLNGQGDYCRYSPASVALYQTEGLQISSPLLADEDSGFEANGISCNQPVQKYLPSSPALCICSDIEEEHEGDQTVPTTNVPRQPEQHHSDQEDTGKVVPPAKPLPKQPVQSKPPLAAAAAQPQPKPEQNSQDKDYQDRVLENFRRRMAAMKGLPTSESHDSDYLTSSNPSSQQLSLGKSNGHPVGKRFPEPSPKCDTNRNVCAQPIPLTPQHHHYSDTGTGESEMESTPLWVPQPMRMSHQLSASGSIREIPCCYSHANMNYYVDQPECLICAGQQESDTLQSSSSYADYVETGLESGQCFCHLNDHDTKSNHWFDQLKSKIQQVPFRKVHWIILGRIQASLVRRKQRAKRAPVERGRRENRARKALRTITFILGAFVLCWTPYHIVIMIKGICDDVARKYTCVNDILYSVTYWLCYMNSPINPFCYALANAQFKKTFLRILHGDFRRT